MIRNTLAGDSGVLGIVLGGLTYLAIIVAVSVQALVSGAITHAIAGESRALSISLLGMNLFVITCIQGGALYLFRVSLQGDFRTARWRVLPVGRHVLRRAYIIDALLNPGAIAALLATWLLVFGYARPSTFGSVVACLLVAPAFVGLSQSLFILAADLLGRFRVLGTAFLVLGIAAVGLLLTGHVARLASGEIPARFRAFMLHDSTHAALRLPPWGLPLFVAERVGTGHSLEVFGAIVAALIGGVLLVLAANRVAAMAEAS